MGVALVAVLSFGVFVAASASAAPTFLLAEWLVNGVAIAEGVELNTESTGELLLEDTKTALGASAVNCSGILLGTVGFDGLDVVSEVLNLAKEAISTTALSGLALECVKETTCTTPLVWAVHLPWSTLLELVEDGTEVFFADLILPGPSGLQPGWYVQCDGVITEPTDECTGEGVNRIGLSGESLTATFEEAFRTLTEVAEATCTQSKEASGRVISIAAAPIVLTGGGTLNASSETSEA